MWPQAAIARMAFGGLRPYVDKEAEPWLYTTLADGAERVPASLCSATCCLASSLPSVVRRDPIQCRVRNALLGSDSERWHQALLLMAARHDNAPASIAEVSFSSTVFSEFWVAGKG
eukprot:2435312-Rhodomonas_salina.2